MGRGDQRSGDLHVRGDDRDTYVHSGTVDRTWATKKQSGNDRPKGVGWTPRPTWVEASGGRRIESGRRRKVGGLKGPDCRRS